MNLATVMTELGAALETISGLRVFSFPPDTATAPAAIVGYPESLEFDGTYGRGMDRMMVPVVLVVGKVSDRSSRDELGAYCDGSGSRSIKATLDGYGSYTEADTVTVTAVDFDTFTLNGTDHIAATFLVDVAGSGE